jgi:excisionase family DNA binding protein
MTVEEAATLLRINTKTAYEKVRRGEIPGGRYIGGVVRVSKSALLEAFKEPISISRRRGRR